jgi:G:T-mismatch repair DNA endonuclease (very short patch repair protein)
VICGAAFKVNPARLKEGQALYCSKKCKGATMRKPSAVLTCSVCRQPYELPGKKTYWHTRRVFCSPECRVRGTKKTSCLETAAGAFLDAIGIKYEDQKKVGTLVVDFWVPSLNLIIETKGCYWHACVECDLPQAKPERRERDRRREARLSRLGYRVVSIWQHQFDDGQAEGIIREAVGVL